MYIDVVVLVVLMVLVVMFFKRFASFVFFMAIVAARVPYVLAKYSGIDKPSPKLCLTK